MRVAAELRSFFLHVCQYFAASDDQNKEKVDGLHILSTCIVERALLHSLLLAENRCNSISVQGDLRTALSAVASASAPTIISNLALCNLEVIGALATLSPDRESFYREVVGKAYLQEVRLCHALLAKRLRG